jgi:LPXTG-motif cell wall-anchored protein
MTRTHPTIKLFTIGAAWIIVGLLFFGMAAMARADDAIFEEPSATRIPNGQHQIRWSFPTGDYQGCLADIEVAETNVAQPSPHPGNQLVVAIDGRVIVRLDIETGRGGASATSVEAVMGNVIEVWYVFGPDNVTSSGFAVSVTCQEEPPSTTTTSSTTSVPPPTTTTSPSTTTTLPPDSSSTTTTTIPSLPTTTIPSPPPTGTTPPPPAVPEPSTVPPSIPTGVPTGEGELPNTGPTLAVVTLGVAGLGLVVLGAAAVLGARRRR